MKNTYLDVSLRKKFTPKLIATDTAIMLSPYGNVILSISKIDVVIALNDYDIIVVASNTGIVPAVVGSTAKHATERSVIIDTTIIEILLNLPLKNFCIPFFPFYFFLIILKDSYIE